MGEAFRDDFGEPGAANQFSQHIAVAEDQLDMIEALPRRLEAVTDGRGMTNELLAYLAREWALGWERAWTQLEEARALVMRRGRDVRTFDAARTEAGDIWNDVAKGKAAAAGTTVYVTWQNVSTRPARDAVSALRAAMPDVVVVKQAPIEVDLRPSSHKVVEILQIAGGIAVVGLVVYVLYRAFT